MSKEAGAEIRKNPVLEQFINKITKRHPFLHLNRKRHVRSFKRGCSPQEDAVRMRAPPLHFHP